MGKSAMNVEFHAIVREGVLLLSNLPDREIPVLSASRKELYRNTRNDDGILKRNNQPDNEQQNTGGATQIVFVYHSMWGNDLTRGRGEW